jgi:hypothetical protein
MNTLLVVVVTVVENCDGNKEAQCRMDDQPNLFDLHQSVLLMEEVVAYA